MKQGMTMLVDLKRRIAGRRVALHCQLLDMQAYAIAAQRLFRERIATHEYAQFARSRLDSVARQMPEQRDLGDHAMLIVCNEAREHFPLLSQFVVVHLWSRLECHLRDVIAEIIEFSPSAQNNSRVKKAMGSLKKRSSGPTDFAEIADRLILETSRSLQGPKGVQRYEVVLREFGISVQSRPEIRTELVRLNSARDNFAHGFDMSCLMGAGPDVCLAIHSRRNLVLTEDDVDDLIKSVVEYTSNLHDSLPDQYRLQ